MCAHEKIGALYKDWFKIHNNAHRLPKRQVLGKEVEENVRTILHMRSGCMVAVNPMPGVVSMEVESMVIDVHNVPARGLLAPRDPPGRLPPVLAAASWCASCFF